MRHEFIEHFDRHVKNNHHRHCGRAVHAVSSDSRSTTSHLHRCNREFIYGYKFKKHCAAGTRKAVNGIVCCAKDQVHEVQTDVQTKQHTASNVDDKRFGGTEKPKSAGKLTVEQIAARIEASRLRRAGRAFIRCPACNIGVASAAAMHKHMQGCCADLLDEQAWQQVNQQYMYS